MDILVCGGKQKTWMCASNVIAALGCCKALEPLNNRTTSYFVLFVFVRGQCSQKHNSNVYS